MCILYESSLVTRAPSAKSCKSETDRLENPYKQQTGRLQISKTGWNKHNLEPSMSL